MSARGCEFPIGVVLGAILVGVGTSNTTPNFSLEINQLTNSQVQHVVWAGVLGCLGFMTGTGLMYFWYGYFWGNRYQRNLPDLIGCTVLFGVATIAVMCFCIYHLLTAFFPV